ncbi:GNAT family N-acetyltransferase [Niveibacterium sp. SC-1]|uniref:GNAT family N-acetyltransferase n=1 Tax=Niveibacterium sp. SC-1 TaxID=3135646 RepID=UPI0031204FC4
MLTLKDITDAQGRVLEPVWLARAEATHRELRPVLPADYALRMAEVFANGARMTVAIRDDAVLGVAVWRIIENTYEGRRLYVDDLVTTARARSGGVGKALMAHLQETARGLGCDVIALDSGTQRTDAHRFYFREGFVIPSFNFRKALS